MKAIPHHLFIIIFIHSTQVLCCALLASPKLHYHPVKCLSSPIIIITTIILTGEAGDLPAYWIFLHLIIIIRHDESSVNPRHTTRTHPPLLPWYRSRIDSYKALEMLFSGPFFSSPWRSPRIEQNVSPLSLLFIFHIFPPTHIHTLDPYFNKCFYRAVHNDNDDGREYSLRYTSTQDFLYHVNNGARWQVKPR